MGRTRKILSLVLSFSLLFQQIGFAQLAAELNIANYFSRISSNLVQERFRPLHLRYFSYDNLKDNFKVVLDKGDLKNIGDKELQSSTQTLLSYFLVGITLPDSMFWVNLRPDSEDQIIDQYLEKTDVGKIMLAADLQLKKDTSAMTSPATPEGREYWDKLYKKAAELYGYDNVTIPTLTRPWIVPGEIIVRESQDSAYVYKANLKVMLEQDYLKDSATYNFKDSRSRALNEYSSQLIRELIIPKLTKEVNSSKRYAPLRQVYYSLILSRWFKLRFTGKTGTYASLINTKDLTNLISKESWTKTDYFKQYQKSFSEGEYNIQKPVYTPTGQVIRSYFSGGIDVASSAINIQNGFTGKDVPSALLNKTGVLIEGNPYSGIKTSASSAIRTKESTFGNQLGIKLTNFLISDDPRLTQDGKGKKGYGVPKGAAIDGSHALEGNQGYFAPGGKEVFLKGVQTYQEFFNRRQNIRMLRKEGIGGQHTPFEAIYSAFQALGKNRVSIKGEYELGKNYDTSLRSELEAIQAKWRELVLVPSSKSGSTDETMMVFVEMFYVFLKYIAPEVVNGLNGEEFASTVLDTMHSVNFKDGRELPSEELFKNFSLDRVVETCNQRKITVDARQVKEIFGIVLGNMVFETTDRPAKSRLSAFIRNSGLDKILDRKDIPGFIAMFDNVGGRWTDMLHMMPALAYYRLDAERYWQKRYEGVLKVREGQHQANILGNMILDKEIKEIILLVPDYLFWFGKAIEQNFNESIWQEGAPTLIAKKTSYWQSQSQYYENDKHKLVINLSGLSLDKNHFNEEKIAVPSFESLSPQLLADTFAQLFATFYGITRTVGLQLISRALIKAGYSIDDVDLNDLDNKATEIVQQNLYTRQPYVELGKEFLEKDLKDVQAKGEVQNALVGVKEKARKIDIQANAPQLSQVASGKDLLNVVTSAKHLAEAEGRILIAVLYLEGKKFSQLREALYMAGVPWVMQGTADQHISMQHVLSRSEKFLPFFISFTPEETLPGRPAVGFAKGYLHNVSPHYVRDAFGQATYDALTKSQEIRDKSRGVFIRMLDSAQNLNKVKAAFVGAYSASSAVQASSPVKAVVASDDSVFEIPEEFIGVNFGTSGHRGEYGKQLTSGIAAAITQGIIGFVNQVGDFYGKNKVIIIGSDPRAFNKIFQEEEVRVALANDFKVLAFERPMPTPIGSFVIRYANEIFELAENEEIVGTINNTPSHNPRTDGGIKLNPGGEFEGAPSEPKVNGVIQNIANGIIEDGKGIARLPDSIDFSKYSNYTKIDPQKVFDVYISHVAKLIDFDKIRQAIREKDFTWNVSTMNGAAGWWMRKAFEAVDKDFFTLFHEEPLADFGALPLGPNTEKIEKQKEYFKDFFAKPSDGKGATDGDGDRFYLADENGHKVNFNVALALVFDYMLNRKNMKGAFLTCVDGTSMFEKIGKVAPRTKIGFKEFQYALRDKNQSVILAGEGGSGGLTLGGHILDKDGIIAQLLFVEMAADAKLRGLKTSDLINELYKKYGYYVMLDTRSIPINSDEKTAAEVKKMVPQILAERYRVGDEIFPGYKIDSIDTTDGLKFFLKEEATGAIHSMLVRPSGTGKEMRDYTEAVSLESFEDGLSIANAIAKNEDGLVNQLIDEAIGKITASSAVQKEAPDKAGGIDFRALPMTIQPMGSFTGLNFKLPQLTQAQLKQINIDAEIQQIKNMVKSGILPSGERIKELIAACSQKGQISAQADNLLFVLADICKLEEENARESSPELREALVIVDSLSNQV